MGVFDTFSKRQKKRENKLAPLSESSALFVLSSSISGVHSSKLALGAKLP